MHQSCWRLGLRTDPTEGAYSAPPYALAEFKGPTSKDPTSKGKGRGHQSDLCLRAPETLKLPL